MAIANAIGPRRAAAAIARMLAASSLILTGAVDVAAERVERVIDGDSIVVSSGAHEFEVRIADVDAPELDQPGGEEAKTALEELVAAREVHVGIVGGDQYRRVIADVYVDGRNVAAELVARGHAWVRRQYAPASRLIDLEDAAREAQIGLWTNPEPVPPWIWRKRKRAPGTGKSVLGPLPAPVCGTKTRCSDMSSCEEAIAYLHDCDLQTIDGDGDGVPCEELCRYYR